MTKTHSASTSKGTLYGIRFNQKKGVSHWVSPYAWLNHGDDWYLVKYLTPTFFVKWFPWLMNMVSHEAWKVDKKEIFDNPEFQIPDDEATIKQPEDKLGASKYTIGIVGGPAFAVLLFKIAGIFFPSNDYVPFPMSSIYSFFSLVLTAVFVYIVFKIFKINIANIMRPVKVSKKKEDSIKYHTSTHEKINIYFKSSFFNKSGVVLILKYLFALSSISFVLMMLLMQPTAYSLSNYDPAFDSTAGVVRSGFIMYMMLFIFTYLPSQTTNVFPVVWRHVNIKAVSIEEESK